MLADYRFAIYAEVEGQRVELAYRPQTLATARKVGVLPVLVYTGVILLDPVVIGEVTAGTAAGIRLVLLIMEAQHRGIALPRVSTQVNLQKIENAETIANILFNIIISHTANTTNPTNTSDSTLNCNDPRFDKNEIFQALNKRLADFVTTLTNVTNKDKEQAFQDIAKITEDYRCRTIDESEWKRLVKIIWNKLIELNKL